MKHCLMFLLIVAIGLTGGCINTHPVVIQKATLQMLANSDLGFLRTGITTREEVLLKMGHPSGDFENGRILTYQLLAEKTPERGIKFQILPPKNSSRGLRTWNGGTNSLVLVFNQDNILDKMQLLRIWRPNR